MNNCSLEAILFSHSQRNMNYLPELVLVEIFKYLPHREKFIFTSVCKLWRDVIISVNNFMRTCLWDELVLHIKPKIGKFKKPEYQEFHLKMCIKYSSFCKTLIIYVCPCQNQNLINLVNMIKQKHLRCKSKLHVLIFRKESLNKCSPECQSLHPSFHFTCQSFQDKLYIQNTRNLQYLSLGYDCGHNVLQSLSSVYGKGHHRLRSLNVANLSYLENENYDLSWLGQLQEVTMNANLLTLSLMQSWLTMESKVHLHVLRLLMFDSVIDSLLLSDDDLSSDFYESGKDSKSEMIVISDESDDSTSSHSIMPLEPAIFPKESIWKKVAQAFPFLKVHMILVAENVLTNVLKINRSGIPLTHIVIILQLNQHNRGNCLLFKDWFSYRQQDPELKSLTVHGVEPASLRVSTSAEGENWLDFGVNTVKGIREISLSGLFINVHDLIEGVSNAPTLERLNIHHRDVRINSLVHSSLQLTPSQIKKTEKAISEQMHREWTINKSIPLQVVYKYKCVGIMDIARALLQQHEDIQRARNEDNNEQVL